MAKYFNYFSQKTWRVAFIQRLKPQAFPLQYRKKYDLKKRDDYIIRNNAERLEKARKSQREQGRRGSHNYGSVHVRTRQKGPFVTVATKLCKDDYNTFSSLISMQGLIKHEVIRGLIMEYVRNTKASRKNRQQS